MIWRVLVCLACIAFLTGCGSRANDPWIEALRGIGQVAQEPPVSLSAERDRIREAVRASGVADPIMMVSLPRRQSIATLAIAQRAPGGVTWMDASGIALVLHGGLVISTRGLGHDLMSADVAAAAQAITGNAQTFTRSHQYLSGTGQVRSLSFSCGIGRDARHITETCNGSGHSFENSYHLQGSRIIASRQWLGPEVGYAEIEFLN